MAIIWWKNRNLKKIADTSLGFRFSLSENKNADHQVKGICSIRSIQITYEMDHISLLCNSTMHNALIFIFMYCNLKEKIILNELQVVRKGNIICQIGIIIILVYWKLGLLGPYNRLSCLHLITADIMKLRNYIKQMQQQQ